MAFRSGVIMTAQALTPSSHQNRASEQLLVKLFPAPFRDCNASPRKGFYPPSSPGTRLLSPRTGKCLSAYGKRLKGFFVAPSRAVIRPIFPLNFNFLAVPNRSTFFLLSTSFPPTFSFSSFCPSWVAVTPPCPHGFQAIVRGTKP